MNDENREDHDYRAVEYLQFHQGPLVRWTIAVLGILSWPLILPLALLARLSNVIFRTVAEFLGFVPYFPGFILRYEFYRFALRRCGKNVLVESGSVFLYSDVEVGDNVLIGRYCIVHECDIGSDVLVGERCTFLSGIKQHNYDRVDIPMNRQGGARKRITVGDDCWIGSHSVVAEDIGRGCVVGAGSVVTRPIPENSVAVGSPAAVIRTRSSSK